MPDAPNPAEACLSRRVALPRLSAVPGGRGPSGPVDAGAQTRVAAAPERRVSGAGAVRPSGPPVRAAPASGSERKREVLAPVASGEAKGEVLAPERRASASGPPKARLSFAGVLPPARIPPESLASPRRMSTFGVAVAISVGLHAVAMVTHFTLGSGRLTDNGPPLQVALVNAKSASKPVKAD